MRSKAVFRDEIADTDAGDPITVYEFDRLPSGRWSLVNGDWDYDTEELAFASE